MYRIMLADDEGIVIDSLKFIIGKEFGQECIVESAKTGRSVIELAENFRPDIAIMDIQMPGINGIEAMREMKEANSHTVFIVMSAYDKFDYAKEAINLGVLEYLNKPMERGKIVHVLKRAMAIIDKERAKRSQDLLIREKMESVVPIIENGLIYNLLFQEYFEEDIENFKRLLGITEQYGYMAVLVFGEEQEGNHMTNAVGVSIRMQNYYLEIREFIRDYLPGIMGNVTANKIALYIPHKEPKMEYNERIRMIEKSRELVRKLKERFDISFRCGMGSVRRPHECMDSYHEALDSLVQTTGKVAHVDDLPMVCRYEENYPLEIEKALFGYVNKGDINGAAAEAGSFFDWMAENYPQDMPDVKLKVLEFALWAEHIAYESGGQTYHFRARHDYLQNLMDMKEMEEVRAWFLEKVMEACRNVAVKKEESSGSVIDKARYYIDSHYKQDISLDDVSRHVDISPYYFSKLFKEETGKNFIEYLTAIRMEKAKELIAEAELSMKEICGEVGYSDPNYFSRIFKKNTGLTPTEYKEGRGQ